MRAKGRITQKDTVVITISINKEIPLDVFHDLISSCRAAFWEYIDTRKETDEAWKEVTPFD